jgi:hypothetical protein
MVTGGCSDQLSLDQCPCADDDRFCPTAGAMELGEPIAVAVVPDDLPLLQALRAEVRPSLPEIDGLLGLDALAALRIDLDYPNDRVLLGCRDVDRCRPRPGVRSLSSLDQLVACGGLRIPPLAGGEPR